jgi:hypothetical protein
MSGYGVEPDEMKKASLVDQKIEALLAGQPVAPTDAVATELAAFRDALGGAFPLPVISEAIEDAHLVRMMEAVTTSSAASTLVLQSARPTTVQRLRVRLSSKVAAATFAFTTAFGGAAYAGVLPQPVQDAVAKAASILGIDLPSSNADDLDAKRPNEVADPTPDADRDRVPVGADDEANDDDARTDGNEDRKDDTQDQADDRQSGEDDGSEDGDEAESDEADDDRDESEDRDEDEREDNHDSAEDARDEAEDVNDDDQDESEDHENDDSLDDSVDDAGDEVEGASDEADDLDADDRSELEESSDHDED